MKYLIVLIALSGCSALGDTAYVLGGAFGNQPPVHESTCINNGNVTNCQQR